MSIPESTKIIIGETEYNINFEAAIKSGILQKVIKTRPIKRSDLKVGDICKFKTTKSSFFDRDVYLMSNSRSKNKEFVNITTTDIGGTVRIACLKYDDTTEFAVLQPNGLWKTTIEY